MATQLSDTTSTGLSYTQLYSRSNVQAGSGVQLPNQGKAVSDLLQEGGYKFLLVTVKPTYVNTSSSGNAEGGSMMMESDIIIDTMASTHTLAMIKIGNMISGTTSASVQFFGPNVSGSENGMYIQNGTNRNCTFTFYGIK